MANSLNEKSNGKPAIWLYFRAIPDYMLADPGEQLKPVLAFRDKIETEKKFFYVRYEQAKEWEKLFREHLCRWLDNLPPATFQPELLSSYVERIKELEARLEKTEVELIKVAYLLAKEGREQADSGRLTKAEEFFAKAIAMSPQPGIINDYGLFLMRIGALKKAEDGFIRLSQLGERADMKVVQAVAYGNLGNLYLTRGDLKEAEEMYKKSLAIFTAIGNTALIRKVRELLDELKDLSSRE